MKYSLRMDSARLKRVALIALLFTFAAHAFCFFNLTYSGSAVMLDASSGRSAQIAGGQYLQPPYWRLRGNVAAPLFVGLLSALYLALTVYIAAALLRLKQTVALALLSGVMIANAAVTSLCAGSLHTADAAFLAMLLAAMAAACLRLRFGALPGALLVCAALALDASAGSFFAALALISLMVDLTAQCSPKAWCTGSGRMLLALLTGCALHAAGYRLMLARNGLEPAASLQSDALSDAWLTPMRTLLEPLTAYASLNVVLRVLLAVLLIALLAASARALGPRRAALLALCLLLLPLACNLPALRAGSAPQITPAYCLLDACAVALFFHLPAAKARLRRLAAGAFGVLLLGSIVFSNQVYLKKNLEFESTLSLMTRVIARAEEMEGYSPGYTPVALIGTPEDSVFSVERKGFEHLSALDAAANHYAVADDADMTWYIWQVLGYPFGLVSTFELEQLKANAQVQAMPAFPAEGCCAFVGDTLVIKLSSY